MRFFTLAWWRGDQSDGNPAGAYAAHLASLGGLLPPDLLAAEESAPLHDARLRELRLLVAERTLAVTLDCRGGGRLTLEYGGVERLGSSGGLGVGLGRPAGYGDLGYTEADVLPGGALEHRLLFSTGIELAVAFRDFRLLASGCAAGAAEGGAGPVSGTEQ